MLAAMLTIAGFAALEVDLPAARWVAGGHIPGDLRKIIALSEVFAHGSGVTTILIVAWVMDPDNRRRVLRLGMVSLGSGLVSNLLKMVICRWRPRHFEPTEIMASFAGWFPILSAGSEAQSTPSSHTATSVGLALGLIWLYPRGRWLFVTLTLLAACQRIVVRDHYVSDVCWGAAIGVLVTSVCFGNSHLPRWLDRFEARPH